MKGKRKQDFLVDYLNRLFQIFPMHRSPQNFVSLDILSPGVLKGFNIYFSFQNTFHLQKTLIDAFL